MGKTRIAVLRSQSLKNTEKMIADMILRNSGNIEFAVEYNQPGIVENLVNRWLMEEVGGDVSE